MSGIFLKFISPSQAFHRPNELIRWTKIEGDQRGVPREKMQTENTSPPKIWFASFADGSERYRCRLRQFKEEIDRKNLAHGWFDETIFCDDSCIDENFLDANHHIFAQHRGHGFWIWKPYIVNKILHQMRADDILVYADVGCEINFETGEKRFKEYLELVTNSPTGMIGMKLGSENNEFKYTKGSLRNYIGLDDVHWQAAQLVGGIQILRKCAHSIQFANDWLRLATFGNGKFIDDSTSDVPNHPEFKDNRHDQSIQSVLKKKMGFLEIPDETYPPEEQRKNGSPILASRVREC